MAEQTTYTCDECGRQKGETNHWFRAEHRKDKGFFAVAKWDARDTIIGEYKVLHLCGLECTTKAMHKAMSE